MSEDRSQQPEWLRAIAKSRATVLSIIGLTIAGAVIFSLLQPKTYTGKTRLLVRPFPGVAGGSGAVLNLETEAELAGSDAVAELAAHKLQSTNPDALVERFEAKPVPETEVLLFAFDSSSSEAAARGAAAFAEAYIEFRRRQALDIIATARDLVTQRIAATQAQIERIDNQLQTRDPEPGGLDTQRQVLVFQLAALQDRLAELQPDLAELSKGEIITPAEPPRAPSSPMLLTNLVLAAVLGTGIGVAVAVVRDNFV